MGSLTVNCVIIFFDIVPGERVFGDLHEDAGVEVAHAPVEKLHANIFADLLRDDGGGELAGAARAVVLRHDARGIAVEHLVKHLEHFCSAKEVHIPDGTVDELVEEERCIGSQVDFGFQNPRSNFGDKRTVVVLDKTDGLSAKLERTNLVHIFIQELHCGVEKHRNLIAQRVGRPLLGILLIGPLDAFAPCRIHG